MATAFAGRARTVARSFAIMCRRGLVDPRRPWESLAALRVSRRAGPFAAMLVRPVRHLPDHPAIVDDRGALTFRELDSGANALARGLSGLGIAAGGILGVLCRDHRGVVTALVAAGRLGVRVVFLNTGFAPPQLADVVLRERITAVLVDPEFVPATAALPARIARILARGDGDLPSVDALIASGDTAPVPLPRRPGGMVLLTSGTTGAPKGASRNRISPFQSAQFLDRVPLSPGGAMVVAAPIFHGTGLGQFILAMGLGKTVVLNPGPFDAAATLAAVARHRADTVVVVPTMLSRMLDAAPGALDLPSLRIITCGGSALSPALCVRTAARFGPVLYNLYGSTEVAQATVATPEDLSRAPGTVGRAPVGCRVALYDERRTPIVEPGERGTIFVHSGLSFTGYTDGRGKEVVDGLFSTGDIGHFDSDGLLFVDGREDDMIVSGGENVYPVEIENLLAARADVRDVAVVGVADSDFGQRLRVFVVRGSAAPSADEIRAHVRANLARHKVPRDVEFVAEIPRNSMGKILRHRLVRADE